MALPDLCARVNFRLAHVVRDGVGYVGFVSAHRTQVGISGCKRLCADLVMNPGRGKFGLSVRTEGELAYGGFVPVQNNLVGALRATLAVHIVIFFTSTDCIARAAIQSNAAAAGDCNPPPNPPTPECLERPIPPGQECIYCVAQENPHVRCTIEQDTVTHPCTALGLPIVGGSPIGGDRQIDESFGATVIPDPGMADIFGDGDPFGAGGQSGGVVKAYTRDNVFTTVDPVLSGPSCTECGTWLCATMRHYVDIGVSWRVQCTDVLPFRTRDTSGACCLSNGACITITPDDAALAGFATPKDMCEIQQAGARWMGDGTSCECVNCDPFFTDPKGACCLPNHQCIEVTESQCVCHGGVFQGLFSRCATPGVDCGSDADPNLDPRPMFLNLGVPIAFVHFSFSTIARRCFQVFDPHCFSTGPTSTSCGADPCWFHIEDGSNEIIRLDSLGLVANMRFAEPTDEPADRYPKFEPECVTLANSALALVDDRLLALTMRGRFHSYDGAGMNLWRENIFIDCAEAPVVGLVTVEPYKTACRFPAELVMTGIEASLWVSGDPGGGGVRIAAVFHCRITLSVRLLPGWQDVDCPIKVKNDVNSPCNPQLSDPDRYLILASGTCTRVPLDFTWKGLVGPAPWATGDFGYKARAILNEPCHDLLCAMDELVIPGQVNDTNDPTGLQHFGGEVVLFLGGTAGASTAICR